MKIEKYHGFNIYIHNDGRIYADFFTYHMQVKSLQAAKLAITKFCNLM